MPKRKMIYSEVEKEFIRNLGFRVQYLRKKLMISQEELAERADLSYTTIAQLESSRVYGISIVALYRISKALEVEPYQLLQLD